MTKITTSKDEIGSSHGRRMMEDDKSGNSFSAWFAALSRRKSFRCGILALIVIFVYTVLFLSYSLNDAFSVAGGAVGAGASLFVVLNIALVQGFDSSTSILFWRTLCDLGLAIRFLLIPAFNIYICGSTQCTRDTAGKSNHSYPRCCENLFPSHV